VDKIHLYNAWVTLQIYNFKLGGDSSTLGLSNTGNGALAPSGFPEHALLMELKHYFLINQNISYSNSQAAARELTTGEVGKVLFLIKFLYIFFTLSI